MPCKNPDGHHFVHGRPDKTSRRLFTHVAATLQPSVNLTWDLRTDARCSRRCRLLQLRQLRPRQERAARTIHGGVRKQGAPVGLMSRQRSRLNASRVERSPKSFSERLLFLLHPERAIQNIHKQKCQIQTNQNASLSYWTVARTYWQYGSL